MKKKFTLLFVVFIALMQSAVAQQISVSGTIRDVDGMEIIGASVIIKGTYTGVSSDVKGWYEIETNVGDTLVCSYLGYKTVEAVVSGAVLDFTLETQYTEIDEVIVIGYGTAKKGDITGAVSSIKMDEMSELPVTNSIMNSLQGRVAGLQIVTSGQGPGASPTMIIRGASSLRGTQQPLVVLNGFPLGEGADLKQIPAEDIEDIVVLKDASSTSIYGSRGANGVIMVTTKKSRAGQRSITASHQTTIGQTTSEYDVWNDAVLMAQLNNESRINAGQTPLYVGRYDSGIYYPSIAELMSGAYPTTNWADQVTTTPITNNTTVTLRGANETTNYNFSINYFDQKGIYIDDDYNKLSANLDFDYKLYEKFSIKTSVALSTNERDNNNYGGITRNILYPVYGDDGTYFKANNSDYWNPVALRDLVLDKTKGMDLISSVLFDWEIIDGLTWKNQVNYRFSSSITDQYDPTEYTQVGDMNGGRAYIGNWQGQDLLFESYANYTKQFGKHNLSVLAGYSYQNWMERSSALTSYDFPNEALQNENMSAGNPELNAVGNGLIETKLMSFYGKVNYDYDDRYLFTGTFRADGSSKFGANNRWASFPSAAVAWKIHNEGFMENVDVINEAKLRASYGLSGNQGISPYQTLSRYGGSKYFIDGGWSTVIGPGYPDGAYGPDYRFTYWSGIPNADLKWETTAQLNIGLDLSMLKNRLRFTFDWYDKLTTDLLRQRYLPLSSGYDKMMVNDGEIRNTGFEITVDYGIISTPDLYLGATLIFTKNTNEILSLGDNIQSGLQVDPNTGMMYEFTGHAFSDYSLAGQANILAVGQAMNAYYGYVVDGIIQTEAEGIAAGLSGALAKPGEYKYVDINDDGVINDADRTIIGNPNPDFAASLNLTFNWKGLDASVFINGVFGNDVLNPQAFNTASVQPLRWTPDNQTNLYPSLRSTRVPMVSDWFIEDGSYVKIQDISVGYTFTNPMSFVSKIRLYATVNNVYTFTSFDGYDPSVGLDGIYWASYPTLRNYSLGLSITF